MDVTGTKVIAGSGTGLKFRPFCSNIVLGKNLREKRFHTHWNPPVFLCFFVHFSSLARQARRAEVEQLHDVSRPTS